MIVIILILLIVFLAFNARGFVAGTIRFMTGGLLGLLLLVLFVAALGAR